MKRTAVIAAAALALAACATTADAPVRYRGPLTVEGTAVSLDKAVAVGGIVLTPMKVVEDSRCPINARCMWAGRIIVTTKVDGAGWRETVDLELGEPRQVGNYRVALVSAEPGRLAGQETDHADYRFVYEGGQTGIVAD